MFQELGFFFSLKGLNSHPGKSIIWDLVTPVSGLMFFVEFYVREDHPFLARAQHTGAERVHDGAACALVLGSPFGGAGDLCTPRASLALHTVQTNSRSLTQHGPSCPRSQLSVVHLWPAYLLGGPVGVGGIYSPAPPCRVLWQPSPGPPRLRVDLEVLLVVSLPPAQPEALYLVPLKLGSLRVTPAFYLNPNKDP